MKRLNMITATLATLMMSAGALASDAETSASAGSSRYQRNGAAAASATYDGRVGFARTNAQSGPVSSARGVAVGVDEDGISLSISNAIASRLGPAIATTFNLSIDRDGGVSRSTGLSVARGSLLRLAIAGGQAAAGQCGSSTSAFASGKTDRCGRVEATTRSQQTPARTLLVVRRPVPCELVRYRSSCR